MQMLRIAHDSRRHDPADERNFVMPALTQRLLGGGEDRPVRLYRVTFREGARTYWHSHDDVQVLFGIAGTCVVVDRDGGRLLLERGDAVVIDPGEEHWHGAAPGTGGEHLAINLGTGTTWLESSA
jgi:quercetin dioxygenase-like cupin family protein